MFRFYFKVSSLHWFAATSSLSFISAKTPVFPDSSRSHDLSSIGARLQDIYELHPDFVGDIIIELA